MRRSMTIGQIFGRLTTVSRAESSRTGKSRWLCSCSCGSSNTVTASDLWSGTISCGCALREWCASDRRHGHARRSGRSPEYSAYRAMMKRCYNPKEKSYPRYGGRGISVCQRWLSDVSNFLADMGPRPSDGHSIDRINVNGNYEPNNCRWATSRQQQNNRTNNRVIKYKGEDYTLAQLTEKSAVKSATLAKRLDRGWTVDDAISLPASAISPQRSASRPIVRRSVSHALQDRETP